MQALPYLPSFYFGSLMMLIGWEIIRDWLIGSYYKVTPKEFGLLWATFIAISLGK
jgi:SulP family sulfate permease